MPIQFFYIVTSLPKTSLHAVYGVLAALVSAGLVPRIEPVGSSAPWEAHVGDNHPHMVCLTAKSVEDVGRAVGASPCLTPSNVNGFVIQSAEITFWGLCSTCELGIDAP